MIMDKDFDFSRYVTPLYSFTASQVLLGFHEYVREPLIDQWKGLTENDVKPWATKIGGRFDEIYTSRIWAKSRRAGLINYLDWALEQFIAMTIAQRNWKRVLASSPMDTNSARFREMAIAPIQDQIWSSPWDWALEFSGRLLGIWMRTCPIPSILNHESYDKLAGRFHSGTGRGTGTGNGGFTKAYALEHLPLDEQGFLYVLMYDYTYGGETGGFYS